MQFLFVVPKLFKELDKVIGVFIALRFLNRIVGIVAAFTAKINRSKAIDGHIGAVIRRHKAHHLFVRDIGLEGCFASDPVCTFFCNRFLCQLIAQLHFKLSTV